MQGKSLIEHSMAYIETFSRHEIPYKTLEKYGLTKTMIDDLPKSVMQKLLTSRKTPVMPVISQKIDGTRENWPAQISLKRTPNGIVDVYFAPVFESNDLGQYPAKVQDSLRAGMVVLSPFQDKGECYVQFNNTINQVMAVDAQIVRHNIDVFAANYGLDEQSRELIREGRVVEQKDGENIISIGLDLNEPLIVRIAGGNALQWEEEAKADYLPRYNFGVNGCWEADDNNVLKYVPKEEYTEEMSRQENVTRSNMSLP